MSTEATFLKLNTVRRSLEDHVIANVKKIDRTKIVDNIIVSFKVDIAGDSMPSVIFDIHSNALRRRLSLIEITVRDDNILITISADHNTRTNYFKLTVSDIHKSLTKNQIVADDLRTYISSHYKTGNGDTQSFNSQPETLVLTSSGDINGGLKRLIETKRIESEAIVLLKDFMEKIYPETNDTFEASSDSQTARYTITSTTTKMSISFSIDKKTRYTSTLINETRYVNPDISKKLLNERTMRLHNILSQLWVMCIEVLEICPIVFMRNCGVTN